MKMLQPISFNHHLLNNGNHSLNIFDEFDRMLDGVKSNAKYSMTPACDIEETKDYFLMTFDVPGVKEEDLNIDLSSNQIIVSGHRGEAESSKSSKKSSKERWTGAFKRTFTMPENIDDEQIEAIYENGILKIALPKLAKAKDKKVKIHSKKDGVFSKLLENNIK